MPLPTPLVHPRLAGALAATGRFPETVTIEQATTSRSPLGAPVESWDTVPGLEQVACSIAAPSNSATGAGRTDEQRSRQGRWAEHSHVIGMAGHYPQVDETMRARLADGRRWDIVGTAVDSGRQVTYLACRAVDETGDQREPGGDPIYG